MISLNWDIKFLNVFYENNNDSIVIETIIWVISDHMCAMHFKSMRVRFY